MREVSIYTVTPENPDSMTDSVTPGRTTDFSVDISEALEEQIYRLNGPDSYVIVAASLTALPLQFLASYAAYSINGTIYGRAVVTEPPKPPATLGNKVMLQLFGR